MAEFVRRLRLLALRPVRTAAELTNWQSSADELLAWVRAAPADIADAVPQFVWHYLSDADRRLHDPRYRKEQQEEIEAALEEMADPAER